MRRWLVPETVQASAMDCGPASLKSLLEGFGIPASYGRLREACQTDVDGTSIDTLEEVARQLGLEAEQVMLPLDHLLVKEAEALPALVVVRLPSGVTHFLVVWRRHGKWLQLMDPATGRRWVTARRFLDDVYLHTTPVSAEAWREWAGSEDFLRVLRRRLAALGIQAELDSALADPGWRRLAALDAATRLVDSMVRSGGVRRGRQAARLLRHFIEHEESIPSEYWPVREGGAGELLLRGAVLLRVKGRRPAAVQSPELAAALEERPARPGLELLRLLRADGLLAPAMLAGALAMAAGAVLLEALLFRSLFELGRELGLSGQRLGALAGLLLFLCALLLLELPLAASLLRMGRHLEIRLRRAFLEKIPRLGDRYFQSRLRSDMAERSHSIHRIRHLPEIGGHLLRSLFELVLTAAGIAWLDPVSAPLAATGALAAVALPLAAQPLVIERDLRLRSHTGALCRYYLDALLGLAPIRVHGAQRAMRREHGRLLAEWASAGLRLQRVAVWAEAMQFVLGFGLAAWLLLAYLGRNAEAPAVLLLVYWALNLPALGQEVALVAWQYPAYRNMALRLLEPLGALEERESETVPHTAGGPASVALEKVTVRAAGRVILEDIDLEIRAGEHVAIVGPSGAGKSSLVGILLGWHRAVAGRVLVDGAPIEGRIDELRRGTAWVDPAVHLWNRSFFENLRYGSEHTDGIADVIEAADLRRVLESLPDGFETPLGEGGALVSGGEGQRVRLGRALLRPDVRLVILDEPFRGLDRGQRRRLLARARAYWRGTTLLCITHDVGETGGFDRVVVVEKGRIVADGGARYQELVAAEQAVREGAWSDEAWRRVRLEGGRLL